MKVFRKNVNFNYHYLMILKINEIFCSIQGESTWTGLPCTFVRLSGCNLRCVYCDTQYAYEEGRQWSRSELLMRLADYRWKRVCITGGEPLLQEGTPALITHLLDNGYQVSLETNGSFDISKVDPRCMKIVDIKCPSSGMQHHNWFENLNLLNSMDQVKFVIANPTDFQYACNTAKMVVQRISADRILFSPAHGQLNPDQLASWMLDGHIDARLQIQLHKCLWPNKDRGV